MTTQNTKEEQEAYELGGKLIKCMQEHFDGELESNITDEQRIIVDLALNNITTALQE